MQTQQLAAVAPLHHRSPRALAPAGGCVLRRTAVRQLRGVALPCRVQVARRTRGSAATASLGAAGQLLPLPVCSFRMGDSTVTLETGRIGRQANGSVLAREGETAMLTTICAAEPSSDTSFLPLTVVYQERFSAAGTTSSGFVKREGKARDNEVLISRFVDRPLRPVFADGFFCETQVLQLLMAWGGTHAPDALAITAAGAAAAISDIPLSKPVAGVRVGWPRGAAAPIVNPSIEQMSDSLLDLVIAGTSDAILMIEGFCDFLTEEQMLVAVEAGHSAVRGACIAISEWCAACAPPSPRAAEPFAQGRSGGQAQGPELAGAAPRRPAASRLPPGACWHGGSRVHRRQAGSCAGAESRKCNRHGGAVRAGAWQSPPLVKQALTPSPSPVCGCRHQGCAQRGAKAGHAHAAAQGAAAQRRPRTV